MGEHSSYLGTMFGPMLLSGLAAGLTFMPAASVVVGGVDPRHAGAASGMLQTMQQLGGAIGLAVVASVYARGSVAGAFVPGFGEALLTCASFALPSFAAAAPVMRPRP